VSFQPGGWQVRGDPPRPWLCSGCSHPIHKSGDCKTMVLSALRAPHRCDCDYDGSRNPVGW